MRILSAYVVFLAINLVVNLVTAYLIMSKRLSAQSPAVHALTVIQTLLQLFFTVMIIRIVVKSGFKA
jgi:hypothetical protein